MGIGKEKKVKEPKKARMSWAERHRAKKEAMAQSDAQLTDEQLDQQNDVEEVEPTDEAQPCEEPQTCEGPQAGEESTQPDENATTEQHDEQPDEEVLDIEVLNSELVEDDVEKSEAPEGEEVKIFYKSELIEEEAQDEIVELEPLNKQAEPQEDVVEVVYEVDPIADDEDESYKLPKLINLPNLITFMLESGMSKQMKFNMALILGKAYEKFRSNKDEKKIVLRCMYIVLSSIAAG